MSLSILIQGCIDRNTKSQEQLYRMFSVKLFSVCLKYSRNYAEAEDNLQDGFLIIFDKIKQYKNTGSFDGWAKRIMINNVLQQYRKTTFLELVNDVVDDTVLEIDDENVSLDYLLRIIQELPDRYRLVFNLYVMDGYTHREIAEMLGITDGTSKSNLARAKMILKEKIEVSQEKIFPSAK
ncbi:sigma-70 family RNA polymerase sigma factor [Flavobacterium sp.]|uniref:RNA polymerase sigma factor n=1 Tax=Flavobacterium sp. TaxID=239 RepID=UPI00286E70AF|nr:sigma-70 family RNA polymerase sigma factor [Flavobacterium sp.]